MHRRSVIVALAVIIAAGTSGLVIHYNRAHQRQLDMELIKACYVVDTATVVDFLRRGADPCARYGSSGPGHFQDSRGGYPNQAKTIKHGWDNAYRLTNDPRHQERRASAIEDGTRRRRENTTNRTQGPNPGDFL